MIVALATLMLLAYGSFIVAIAMLSMGAFGAGYMAIAVGLAFTVLFVVAIWHS